MRIDADNFLLLNGIDVAKRILKYSPDANIIFVTGHSMDKFNKSIREYVQQCENDLGMDIMFSYVHKNSNSICEDIEKVISKQRI